MCNLAEYFELWENNTCKACETGFSNVCHRFLQRIVITVAFSDKIDSKKIEI